MLGKRSQMQRMLLEANGLSTDIEAAERARIRDDALRDHRKARRMQAIAVFAWIVHSVLFVINFWKHANQISGQYGESIVGLGRQTFSTSMAWSTSYDTPMGRLDSGFLSYALYWLNGWVFLIAVIATIWWFFRDRAATTSEYEFRLASVRREEKPEN